jgi:hypothetical protein
MHLKTAHPALRGGDGADISLWLSGSKTPRGSDLELLSFLKLTSWAVSRRGRWLDLQ